MPQLAMLPQHTSQQSQYHSLLATAQTAPLDCLFHNYEMATGLNNYALWPTD